MGERKEWKSLYMINKQIHFLGFRPIQWIIIASFIFVMGWFAWWIGVVLLVVTYYVGRRVSRIHDQGNPNYILSLIVWISMRKYFRDDENIFDKLTRP